MNFTKTILLCFTRNKSKKTNKYTKFKFKFKKYTLHHCVFNKLDKINNLNKIDKIDKINNLNKIDKIDKIDKMNKNTIFYYLYTNNINSIKSSP